jgi:hypothetical protein
MTVINLSWFAMYLPRAAYNTAAPVIKSTNEERRSIIRILHLGVSKCGAGVAQSVRRLDYGLGNWVRLSAGARDFSLLHGIQVGSGAHPASYSGVLSPDVKRAGEADYSPLSNAEVRNSGAIPPLPMCLHYILFNTWVSK